LFLCFVVVFGAFALPLWRVLAMANARR